MFKNGDESIWEFFGFILAMLCESNIISTDNSMLLIRTLVGSYRDIKIFLSKAAVEESYRFYRTHIARMVDGRHSLPDVIVYNLTNPSGGNRVSSPRIEMVDAFNIYRAWAIISDTMGYFFYRSDEDITKLPLGVNYDCVNRSYGYGMGREVNKKDLTGIPVRWESEDGPEDSTFRGVISLIKKDK